VWRVQSWVKRLPNRSIIIATSILCLAASGVFFYHKTPPVAAVNTILLGAFSNETGDSVFEGGLREALAEQLEQSPYFTLVSESRIHEVLRLTGRQHDNQMTPEIALDLCQRTQSGVAITGKISRLGTGYELVLSAVGCESRETVSIVTGNATDQSTVLLALTKGASTLRKNLGESVATLQKYQTPGELASTPSLEAWKTYSQGREEMVGRSDSAAAVPFFRHAIDLDSKFAMAYAALGTCYFNMGQKQLAAENTTTAFRLRDKVSEREKYYIESHYYHLAAGDLQQARNVYAIWARTYTQDTVPQTNLGEIYGQLGQHESSLDAYKKGLDLAPGSGLNYGSLFDTYVNLDRFQEAHDVLEQMKKTKTSSNDLRHHVYQLAFYQNDQDVMARQTEWASSNPDDSGVILHFAAETSALHGQLGQAREWTRKAVD